MNRSVVNIPLDLDRNDSSAKDRQQRTPATLRAIRPFIVHHVCEKRIKVVLSESQRNSFRAAIVGRSAFTIGGAAHVDDISDL